MLMLFCSNPDAKNAIDQSSTPTYFKAEQSVG